MLLLRRVTVQKDIKKHRDLEPVACPIKVAVLAWVCFFMRGSPAEPIFDCIEEMNLGYLIAVKQI